MSTDWIFSSNKLPCEGQRIEFILDQRSVAMEGTCNRQGVRTRWAEYDIKRVQKWRNPTLQCEPSRPDHDNVASAKPVETSPDPSQQ
jgi:hypothetical protein